MKLSQVRLTNLFHDRNLETHINTDVPVTYLYGQNGSGKSTLLRLLSCVFDERKLPLLMSFFEVEEALFTFDSENSENEIFLRVKWEPIDNDMPEGTLTKFDFRRAGPGFIARNFFGIANKVTITLVENGNVTAQGVLQPDALRRGDPRHLRLSTSYIRNSDIRDSDPSGEMQRFLLDVGSGVFKDQWDSELSDFLGKISVSYAGTERLDNIGKDQLEPAQSVINKIASYLEREVAKQGRYTNQRSIRHLTRIATNTNNSEATADIDTELAYTVQEVLRLKHRLTEVGLLDEEEASQEEDIALLQGMHMENLEPAFKPLFYELYKEVKDNYEKFEHPARRLETYISILNSRLVRKSVSISTTSGLQIIGNGGKELQTEQLSSGERHLIVLLHEMIFSEDSGTTRLVLVDEPELSLNIQWLREFSDDLFRVNECNPAQFILATHSPFISASDPKLLVPVDCQYLDG